MSIESKIEALTAAVLQLNYANGVSLEKESVQFFTFDRKIPNQIARFGLPGTLLD